MTGPTWPGPTWPGSYMAWFLHGLVPTWPGSTCLGMVLPVWAWFYSSGHGSTRLGMVLYAWAWSCTPGHGPIRHGMVLSVMALSVMALPVFHDQVTFSLGYTIDGPCCTVKIG